MRRPHSAQLLVANLEIDKGNLEEASVILNELNSNEKLNNSQRILSKIYLEIYLNHKVTIMMQLKSISRY